MDFNSWWDKTKGSYIGLNKSRNAAKLAWESIIDEVIARHESMLHYEDNDPRYILDAANYAHEESIEYLRSMKS